MENKTTPGPWNVCENWDDDTIEIGSAEVHAVCLVPKEGENALANAKLIAAAPDLLEALYKAKAMMERDKVGGYTRTHDGKDFAEKGSTYETVITAIKKATE